MNKVAFAAKWSIITEIVVKLISPITNMILARILSPELFGIVASITLVTTFVDLFTDAGFQKYIIQHQFEGKEDYDLSINVAFWTNLYVSGMFLFLIVLFNEKIAIFVGAKGYGQAVSVASITLILTAFSSIQMATYKKSFDFKRLSVIRIICKVVPLLVTVPLALLGGGYWALIIGNLLGEFVNAVLLTAFSKWKPKLQYSIIKLKEMFSFCGWTLCEAITAWLVANMAILLIGQNFNAYFLGIYKGSVTVVNQILSVITAVMSSVILTTLSQLQNEEEKYRMAVLNFQRVTAMFVIPLGVGVFIFHEFVTRVILGSQWDDASILVGVWAIVSSINIVISNVHSYILISKGKPIFTFVSNFIQCFLIIIVFFSTKNLGFYIMFYALSATALQLSVTQVLFANKVFKISEIDKIKNIIIYVLIAALMGGSGYLIHLLYSNVVPDIITIILCIVIYFGVLMLSKKERTFINKLIVNFIHV